MRKFGLIGYPLGHSFSAKYFAEKFLAENISDCLYSNYEIASVGDLPGVLTDPDLAGLNVTIPYKQTVLRFLDEKDVVVEETGACNCIRICKGSLKGFNTDVIGFEKSLTEKLTVTDNRALILGTGGSSKAVAWVLRKKNIPYLFVSRTASAEASHITYEQLTRDLLREYPLIINTTPLGTFPAIQESAPLPYQWIGEGHYFFDLVYNPAKTLFLQKAEIAGARIKNGADMLAVQAEASWEIWNKD